MKHITFASNPCRVRFYTQELVFFRDDLLKKMQRHSVMPSHLIHSSSSLGGAREGQEEEEEIDMSDQLVKLIIQQSHLWPMPVAAKPVHWELDHSMRLTPLPHLVRTFN